MNTRSLFLAKINKSEKKDRIFEIEVLRVLFSYLGFLYRSPQSVYACLTMVYQPLIWSPSPLCPEYWSTEKGENGRRWFLYSSVCTCPSPLWPTCTSNTPTGHLCPRPGPRGESLFHLCLNPNEYSNLGRRQRGVKEDETNSEKNKVWLRKRWTNETDKGKKENTEDSWDISLIGWKWQQDEISISPSTLIQTYNIASPDPHTEWLAQIQRPKITFTCIHTYRYIQTQRGIWGG